MVWYICLYVFIPGSNIPQVNSYGAHPSLSYYLRCGAVDLIRHRKSFDLYGCWLYTIFCIRKIFVAFFKPSLSKDIKELKNFSGLKF